MEAERIAHRGAKRELPENSVPAFVRAFERGAHAIELDVHATRDGVLVVHHDPVVRLPGKLLRSEITDLDLAELRTVELAQGLGVPTLDEVLRAIPPKRPVYVEIKGERLARLVAPVVIADRRCAVHSFDHETVVQMRAFAPDVPRGILFEHVVPKLSAAISATGARDVWPEWPLIDQRLVDEVHELGGRVIAWTVNEPGVIRLLRAMGVDGLCTDDVRLLQAAVAELH